MIETIRLPNGLTVVLQENRLAPVVALQAWVGVGSASETEEIAGIAHVFEHMLFKGTTRRQVGQIAHEIETAGGEINAWTSLDETVYHVVLASRFFDTGLDILTDALRHPSFDAAELERERRVILEEIKQGEDAPSRKVTQQLFATAFTRHPYRRPVIGTVETVGRLKREHLLDFFARHYQPDNITLAIVGDFDRREAERKVRAMWEGGSRADRRPLPRASAVEPPQTEPRVRITAGDTREAYLALAFHVPGVVHADTGALDVGSILLGQGESSRLQRQIKRNRELVQSIYAYSFTPKDGGLLVVGANLPVEQLEAAVGAILEEIAVAANEEFSLDELEKAKAIVESDSVYQKETVQGQARKLGFFQSIAGSLAFEDEYHRQVRELTPRQLKETLAKYLRLENLSLSVILPQSHGQAPGTTAELEAYEAKLGAQLRGAWMRVRLATPAQLDRTAPVVREVLPSGATVLIQPDPTVPLVAIRAVWPGGLLVEDEKTNGINNLLSSLLTRGTKTRSADALAHEIESMAGSMGGFSGRSSFGLRAEVLARHWERGLDIFLDCLLNPRFDQGEIEKERRHIIEELRSQEDSPSELVFRLFVETLYPKHPYRFDVLGTPRSVAHLTRRRLLEYYQRHFPLSGMTLAIVGDVDPALVLARLRRLGERTDDAAASPRVDIAWPAGPLRAERRLDKQQAHLVLGYPGLTLRDPDRHALEVLSMVLSGQGGRLFAELRDKRGLAYRVTATSLEGLDPGYFAVYLATSPENLETAEIAVRDELRRLIDHTVSPAELERAQRYLVGAHDISLQRRSALAAALAFDECYGLGWDDYRRYAANVLAVTADDLRRVAKKYLDPRREVEALLLPSSRSGAAADPEPARKAARATVGQKRGKSGHAPKRSQPRATEEAMRKSGRHAGRSPQRRP